MKNIKFIVLVVAIVLLPQMALASFWNPLTWFKDSKPTVNVVEQAPISDKTFPLPKDATKQIAEPKIIEKAIEKPVIKTITVQDPALQVRIDSLVTDNASLKAEVEKLLQANKSLNKELLTCEDQPVSKDNCEEANDLVSMVKDKILEIDAICKEKKANTAPGKTFFCAEGQSISGLQTKLRSAQIDVQLYCD